MKQVKTAALLLSCVLYVLVMLFRRRDLSEPQRRRSETHVPKREQSNADTGCGTVNKMWLHRILAVVSSRIVFVNQGVLYGEIAVRRFDSFVALVSAAALVAVLSAAYRWKQRTHSRISNVRSETPRSLSDHFATIGTIGTIAALVISGANAFFILYPAESIGLPKPTCAGGHTKATSYVGITAGVNGVNSRSGPARSYPVNGRFSNGCSLGFSSWCIGEPLADVSATTDTEAWVSSRWLMVAKASPGPEADLAQILSGETPWPQLVSDVNITPALVNADLPMADAAGCGAPPSKVVLSELGEYGNFVAQSNNSANIGFSIWVPPFQGSTNGGAYIRMYDSDHDERSNPGAVDSDGRKSVIWDYRSTVQADRAGLAGPNSTVVVVMAIPCIGAYYHASTETATVAAYRVTDDDAPVRVPAPPPVYDVGRLANAACLPS